MLTGQVKLPSQMIEIYCDTCGHPLSCHIEWNGNGEPDQGNKWVVSVERCASCDHRREKELEELAVRNTKLTKEEHQQVAKMIRVGEGAGKRLREFTTKLDTDLLGGDE